MNGGEVEDSIFDQEVKELHSMMKLYETIKPNLPNRAKRRADAKRDRALKKRKPRG